MTNYTIHIENFIACVEALRTKNVEFTNQKQFKRLLLFTTKDIKASTSVDVLIHSNNDLIIELSRLMRKIEPSVELDKSKIAEKTKKLTLKINYLQKEISKIENETLGVDDLGSHSFYTKLPLLYKTMLKLWKKRETLLNRSINSGQVYYKPFRYNGTDNEQMNKIVENYFRNYLSSLISYEGCVIERKQKNVAKHELGKHFAIFNIMELKKALQVEIEKKKIAFNLTDEILTKIYKDLLLENKTRRTKQQEDAFRSVHFLKDLHPESMPNSLDLKLQEELDENETKGNATLRELVESYRKRDLEENGNLDEQQALGWDDKDDDDDDQDDDEEDGDQ